MKRIRSLALVMLALVIGWSSARAATDPASLRLVGVAGGQEFDQIIAENGELRVRSEDGATIPVPHDIRWRLDGDLLANAGFVCFSPSYEIVTRPAAPTLDHSFTRTYAIIWLERNKRWSEREVSDGIAVFVWVVDGRPAFVVPVPVEPRTVANAEVAAAKAFELSPANARGAPVILMLGKAPFISAEPRFDDPGADAALAAMHFGPVEDLPRVFAAVKAINRRARHDGDALLHMAAEGGFAEATRLLLELGGKPDLETANYRTALHDAARNGRVECVRTLLAGGATRLRTDGGRRIPLDRATTNGHLAVALSLLGEKSTADMDELLSLAVEQGDAAAVQVLLARGGNRLLRKLPDASLVDGIATGSPALTQTLLQAGMKADTAVDGIPLLVIAAASGSTESVEAMLTAGTPVDRTDREGVTALMAAVWTGNRSVVEALLRAGADTTRSDKAGRTALDHALAASDEIVARVLREHGAGPGGVPTTRRGDAGPPQIVRKVGVRAESTFAEDEIDMLPRVVSSSVSLVTGGTGSLLVVAGTKTQVATDIMGGRSLVSVSSFQFAGVAPAGFEGWAVVSLIVEPDGRPSAVRVVDASRTKSRDYAARSPFVQDAGRPGVQRFAVVADLQASFARDVLETIEQVVFAPGQSGGHPVRTRVTLYVTP